MPEIYHKIYISLEEFFSKYGFDDGNEEGIGWEHRGTAIEILNKHLKPFGIKADEIDVTSSHNNCHIAFFNKDNKEIEIGYSDGDEIFSVDAWGEVLGADDEPQLYETINQIVNAVLEAAQEFDDEVLDDLSRVLQTSDKNLPLLVGKLNDGNAKKLFDRLMKKE